MNCSINQSKGYQCEFIIDSLVSDGQSQNNQSTQKVEKVLICNSCAKSTRGKFRLTRLSKNINFSCFMGKCMFYYFFYFVIGSEKILSLYLSILFRHIKSQRKIFQTI